MTVADLKRAYDYATPEQKARRVAMIMSAAAVLLGAPVKQAVIDAQLDAGRGDIMSDEIEAAFELFDLLERLSEVTERLGPVLRWANESCN